MNIKNLCKIEISLLASMFQSKELFFKITESITEEDFTFMVNRKIFSHLKLYANEVDFYANEDEKIHIAAHMDAYENIFAITTLQILASKLSDNIDLDLAEILDFSKKRIDIFSEPFYSEKHHSNVVIEDEYGQYTAIYYNGIIKDIYTTYIFNLPDELCDTFKDTFGKLMPYIQKENCNLSMEINKNDPQDIRALVLTKNITKIERVEKLIEWGKENQLRQSIFPSNRGNLLNKITFILDNQNLEYIPDELCEELTQIKFLSLLNNRIKEIPHNINFLKNLILLGLCNNEITSIPDSLFQLNKLSSLCLHGNLLTELPDKIGALTELKSLTISNNSITQLPSSIRELHKLSQIDLENTLINEDSLKFINLENIEKISFDDKLLPYFIKNFHLLKKIDTINLTHSEYEIDNPIFNSLNLNIENESWMEDKDYKGHGCIVLKNL